jgi:hypothetical protein
MGRAFGPSDTSRLWTNSAKPIGVPSPQRITVGERRNTQPQRETGGCGLELPRKDDRDLDPALPAGNVDGDFVVMALETEVEARMAEPQIAQHDFIEEIGQRRVPQPDLIIAMIELQPE